MISSYSSFSNSLDVCKQVIEQKVQRFSRIDTLIKKIIDTKASIPEDLSNVLRKALPQIAQTQDGISRGLNSISETCHNLDEVMGLGERVVLELKVLQVEEALKSQQVYCQQLTENITQLLE